MTDLPETIRDLAPLMPTKYLRDFFGEKDIPEAEWTLEDNGGDTHIIGNVVVIQHITRCGAAEATKIGEVLRRIDFANGDVNDFLRHIAGALINA